MGRDCGPRPSGTLRAAGWHSKWADTETTARCRRTASVVGDKGQNVDNKTFTADRGPAWLFGFTFFTTLACLKNKHHTRCFGRRGWGETTHLGKQSGHLCYSHTNLFRTRQEAARKETRRWISQATGFTSHLCCWARDAGVGNVLGCRFIYFLKMVIPSKTAYSLNESYDCPKGQFGQVRPSARAVSYLNIQFEEKTEKKKIQWKVILFHWRQAIQK